MSCEPYLAWVVRREILRNCELLKEGPASAMLSISSLVYNGRCQEKVRKHCLVALW
jgi:hypothetical protein